MQKQELLGLTVPELERLLADLGEPPYRGKQLYHALYHERQWDLGKVTPFPAALRARSRWLPSAAGRPRSSTPSRST